MKKLHTENQLEEMRKRLYDRGSSLEKVVRHQLEDTEVDVARDWQNGQTESLINSVEFAPNEAKHNEELREVSSVDPASFIKENIDPVGVSEVVQDENRAELNKGSSRNYRTFILGGSLIIFILTAVVSGLYMYMGGSGFSSDNIAISLNGQPVIGGGEVMNLQVAVTNQNGTSIDSGVLILRYPEGTRSVDDNPRDLHEERINLNTIAPSEVQNVPVKFAIFGEMNAEKEIQATVEYRVNGSNGIFYKEAEPLRFRINSSPLVLKVDGVEKVSSGQTVDVVITATANASNPVEDILITTSYPGGFSFKSADPSPDYGQNTWKIDKLMPNESFSVTVKGVVRGLTEESMRIGVEAGQASPDNQFILSAKLADVKKDLFIESPFIDTTISVNGDNDGKVVVSEGENSNVSLLIKNTLDETVYDMAIEVIPKGNSITTQSIVGSKSAFYDSNKGTVRWEVANNPSFKKLLPNESRTLNFNILQGTPKATASYDLTVNVYARRLADSTAQETLIGSVDTSVKYSSRMVVGSEVGRNVGRFGDSGPVPPKVGEMTTYTLSAVLEAGVNDLENGVVKTSLPVYVEWLNQYDASGEVIYNPVSKEIEWKVGSVPAKSKKEFIFQVAVTPSASHVGNNLVLLNKQFYEATDRFTSTRLQESATAVTNELSYELGFERKNGVVIK